MLTQLVAMTTIALSGAPQKANPVDTGMSWLKSAWSRVEREGRPAAERVVRESAAKFKGLPTRVTALVDRAEKTYEGMKLEDKQAFVLELWRVRQSLNLMALLDPDVLEQVTGIDAKTLKATMSKASTLYAQLSKSIIR